MPWIGSHEDEFRASRLGALGRGPTAEAADRIRGHTMGPMTGFGADEGLAREHDQDLSRIPRDLETYAQIEGLVGEENVLLEEAEEDRKEEHRERLHAIAQELDRAWEALRRRAEHRGKPGT
jgi:Protein of unknown function (DUF2630)